MGTSYARVLKPGYANDFSHILSLGNKVRSILSAIAHEGNDPNEFVDEVKIQMQPRPDGGLAIIGWIDRGATAGIPEENYDEEVEFVPVLPDPTAEPIVQENNQNPFQR